MQSICFLTVVYSLTHVRSSIQDKEYRCLILESTAIGARFQTDGGRVVGFKLPEGRTIRVLFHACDVRKSILSLGCLAQQGYWNELCADTVTLTQYSQTQLHMEERVLCHRDADGALDVAQELQMPIGPQALDDEEEPMPSPPAKLKDPIELDQHSLTHFPSQPWCKVCVESRGRDSPQREQSKIDAVVQ